MVRASTAADPSRPTRVAIAATVAGLSPEITFTATPWSAKYCSVCAASGLTCSVSVTSAVGCRSAGSVASTTPVPDRPSSNTRRPVAASSDTRSRMGSSLPSNTSGAPSTQVPRPSKLAADHFLAELNATVSVRRQPRWRRDGGGHRDQRPVGVGVVGERAERLLGLVPRPPRPAGGSPRRRSRPRSRCRSCPRTPRRPWPDLRPREVPARAPADGSAARPPSGTPPRSAARDPRAPDRPSRPSSGSPPSASPGRRPPWPGTTAAAEGRRR